MASPEQNRPAGARPSGAGGVRNLLAMFEKSSSSPSGSPAPAGPANPASNDQSPGPRPLGRVGTSFVAVRGNSNPALGLQKAPSASGPMSPVVSVSEGAKMFGGPLETASEKKVAEFANKQPLDEANLRKHDLETRNGYTAAVPFPSMGTGLSPGLETTSTKQGETISQKQLDSIPTGKNAEEPTKPVKAEPKPKPAAAKAGPAPRSPTKSAFSSSKTNKVAPATKSGKNLTLPPSKSATTSPLPSPALPKSPVRSAASSSSSGSRAKLPTAAQGTGSSSARTRTTTSTSASAAATAPAAPKPPRQPATAPAPATEKAKAPAAKKLETKPAREPTKPPNIRSSAFSPTTASVAKLAADQKALAARSRPPSSASVRNRSPPSSTGMRRGNSGMSSRPGRKDQRSPQRPQTSAAIRHPNRTSVGSVVALPGATGGDFLSRMMRPTTASASKVSDKKPGPMNPPPKRSASVSSTSRRREKSLPPSTGRLQKQTTGEGSKTEGEASIEVAQQPEEAPVEAAETQNQIQEAVSPSKEVINVEVPAKITVEVPTKITVEVEVQESEDGSQSPTTTTSSTTLVHEGEGKDDDEVLAKV